MKSLHICLTRKGQVSFPLILVLILSITPKIIVPIHASGTEIAVINPLNSLNPDVKDSNFKFYTNTTSVGSKFNATLWIFNWGTPPVFAWQATLNYNSTLINATRAWTGATLTDPAYIFGGKTGVNPTPFFTIGSVLVGDSLLGGSGVTPPPEPANLATIEFEVISAPPTNGEVFCDLDIDNIDTFLLDYSMSEISPIARTSGSYEYVWLEPRLEVRQQKYIFADLETFNVTVWLNNVTSSDRLVNLEFALSYNATLLDVTEVTEGPFLKQFGTTVFSHQELIGSETVNITLSPIPIANYPNGNGAIANITFKGIYQDTKENYCFLELNNVQLLNDTGSPMTTTLPINGFYRILALGGSDITINVVAASVTVGSAVAINGTVAPPRISANVTISYRLIGEPSWTNLTTVKTDSNSDYAYLWTATKKTNNQADRFEFKASWPGDLTTNGAESSPPYPTLVVNRESSTISINVSPSSIKAGSNVTVSGQVTPIKSGVSVTLYYSFMNRANITLATIETDSSGFYTYNWTIPKAGTFDFYAQWLGDINTAGDKSDIASATASHATSTLTINVQPTTVTIGSNITISGTIAPTKVGVDVTLTYGLVGGSWTALQTVKTDSNGAYTYTWKTTATGSYQLKAGWNGDDATLGVESLPIPLTVTLPISVITISADPTTVTVGSRVTINGGITPTKIGVDVTIHYKLNTTGTSWSNLTTVKTGSDGLYTYSWIANKTGTFELMASWPGDNTNEPAQSLTALVKVEEQITILTYLPYILAGIAIIVVIAVVIYFLQIRKR